MNLAYYPRLLEGLGFTPSLHFESRRLRAADVPLAYHQKQPALEELARIPFDFIPLTPATWPLLADELFQLVHEVFSQNPAYKAVPRAQFDALYNPAYAAQLCPYSSVLFVLVSGRLAALSLCQPNYHGLNLPQGAAPVCTRLPAPGTQSLAGENGGRASRFSAAWPAGFAGGLRHAQLPAL